MPSIACDFAAEPTHINIKKCHNGVDLSKRKRRTEYINCIPSWKMRKTFPLIVFAVRAAFDVKKNVPIHLRT